MVGCFEDAIAVNKNLENLLSYGGKPFIVNPSNNPYWAFNCIVNEETSKRLYAQLALPVSEINKKNLLIKFEDIVFISNIFFGKNDKNPLISFQGCAENAPEAYRNSHYVLDIEIHKLL